MSRLKHLIHEIHRRSIWQVLGIYVVAGWIAYQVVQSLTEGLRLPEWFPALAIVLLIIGLPIVLATAFVQEGMGGKGAVAAPSSDAGSLEATSAPVVTAYLFTWRNALSGGVLAFAALGFTGALWLVFGGVTVRTVSTEGVDEELLNSVAVLPFTTIGTNQESIDFAAGLHGDLITQLTKVRDLKVTSQTSVVQYAGTDKTIPVIAQELGVLVLLEGVVQRSGDRVRINALLIDGRTDEHLWADTFDREFTVANVFAIQSDIAGMIAAALKATLTDEEQRAIETLPTVNEQAYAAYLAGRAHQTRLLREDDARAAVARFAEAVALDPHFGIAWAALADARSWLVFRDLAGPEVWSHALAAEAEAMRLAPDAPETRMAQGLIAYRGTRDYAQAGRHFGAVRRDRPGDAEAVFWLGVMQKRQGRYAAAADLYQQAARLNPMSQLVWSELAFVHAALGRFSESAGFAAGSMSIAPRVERAYHQRFTAFVLDGDTTAARRHLIENAEATEGSLYWRIFLDHYLKRELAAVADSLDRRRPYGFGADIFYGRLQWIARVNWMAGRSGRVGVLADSLKAGAREALASLEGRNLPLREAVAFRDLAGGEALLGNSGAAHEAIRQALALADGVDEQAHQELRLSGAMLYVILGDEDAAVESLEAYLRDSFGDLSPTLLRLDPFWDMLRDNPRFQALLELERPGPAGP